MSEISPSGTLDNIQKSIDAYLGDNVSNAGLPLHLHGVRRFVPPTSGAWVQVRYDFLGTSRQFYRQTAPAKIAAEVRGTISLNIAEHAQIFTDRYTLTSARDTVKSQFPESGLIPVQDYATSGDPRVGAIWIHNISENLIDDGSVTGMIQHNISVDVRYLEEFTR